MCGAAKRETVKRAPRTRNPKEPTLATICVREGACFFFQAAEEAVKALIRSGVGQGPRVQ